MKIQMQVWGLIALGIVVAGAITAKALGQDDVFLWLSGTAVGGALLPAIYRLILGNGGGPVAMLLVLILFGASATGCGGSLASLHDDACKATRDSCDLALASQARYCGADADPDRATACALTSASAAVCVASLQLWCPVATPAIQRTYPGDVAAQPPQEEISIMGTFNVDVTAVGNHYCQRELRDGATVDGCGDPNCPDCIARAFVAELQRTGANVGSAKLTHWPGASHQVQDDLLTKVRTVGAEPAVAAIAPKRIGMTATCIEVSDWPSTGEKTNERVVLLAEAGGPRAFDAKLRLYVGEEHFGAFAKGGTYQIEVIVPPATEESAPV